MANLSAHLAFLYGADEVPQLIARVEKLIAEYRARIPAREYRLTERDSISDYIWRSGTSPRMKSRYKLLIAFCKQHLSGIINGIHILPFYPWSSDDGFSVVDYRKVDSSLGNWEDISSMQNHFRLMFDGVINHISSQSEWFKAFLRDDPRYRDYFITVEGSPDLSQVVRPRALPLLTTFQTLSGEKRVWTTFSDDQIDLNYKNPEVLLEILDILLHVRRTRRDLHPPRRDRLFMERDRHDLYSSATNSSCDSIPARRVERSRSSCSAYH